jgi:hypothetical protein
VQTARFLFFFYLKRRILIRRVAYLMYFICKDARKIQALHTNVSCLDNLLKTLSLWTLLLLHVSVVGTRSGDLFFYSTFTLAL